MATKAPREDQVMDGKLLARLGAIVFVAVAITATAIEMTRKDEEPVQAPSQAPPPPPHEPAILDRPDEHADRRRQLPLIITPVDDHDVTLASDR